MTRTVFVGAVVAGLVGCGGKMTLPEASEALEQARVATSYEAVTTEPIEVSTDFTLGQALADAAQELAAFWDSQADCTTVSRAGAVTTIDYGTLADRCTWEGRTYAGTHTITVLRTGLTDVAVDHAFGGFTNGELTVDGGAEVTWSADSLTRRVLTDLAWRDLTHEVDVVGDHVFGLLDEPAGVLGGFTLEGTRTWTDARGDWDLVMEDVELRLQDPAPQAGRYALTNPEGKVVGLTFERLDTDTIRCTLDGTWVPWVFDITSTGVVVAE